MQSMLQEFLKKIYDDKIEHVGFVLPNDEMVEVKNMSDNPEGSFDVSGEDILKYEDIAVATWHTHPNGSSNLSAGDMETFLNWPNLDHFIVGTDGITKYVVKDNEVLIG